MCSDVIHFTNIMEGKDSALHLTFSVKDLIVVSPQKLWPFCGYAVCDYVLEARCSLWHAEEPKY